MGEVQQRDRLECGLLSGRRGELTLALTTLHDDEIPKHDTGMTAKPSWQTEELEEEWVDEDDEQADQELLTATFRDVHNTSDISFTQPLHSVIVSDEGNNGHHSRSSSAGTVVVHSDEEDIPILPKTPARGKKVMSKDLFSPLPLEKMFEPPSPPSATPPPPLPLARTSAPAIPSRLSQMYIPGDADSSAESSNISYGVDNTSMKVPSEHSGSSGESSYQFTFAAPKPRASSASSLTRHLPPDSQSPPLFPQTPMQTAGGMLQAPLTDPRLRLFQFQYDTFTREALSAMVDSIAVNTPSHGSGVSASKDSTPAGSSTADDRSLSRLRSAKRLKLSPASDFSPQGDGAAVFIRPQGWRDYVAESNSLMEKIRRARDFSTVSTQRISAMPVSGQKSQSHGDPGHANRMF